MNYLRTDLDIILADQTVIPNTGFMPLKGSLNEEYPEFVLLKSSKLVRLLNHILMIPPSLPVSSWGNIRKGHFM